MAIANRSGYLIAIVFGSNSPNTTCTAVMATSTIRTATVRPASPRTGSSRGVNWAWPYAPATRLLIVIPT